MQQKVLKSPIIKLKKTTKGFINPNGGMTKFAISVEQSSPGWKSQSILVFKVEQIKAV